MISKMVTDRVRGSDSVREALTNLGPEVASKAEALFAPHVRKGEVMPDLGLLASLMERLLGARSEAMEKADSAHDAELADDAEPRAERDDAAAATYAALVDVKQSTVTLFGERWVGKLKLPTQIPQDPSALSRLAPDVIKAIQEAKLPKPRLPGVKSFDRTPWISQLEEPAKKLAKALKGVTREVREAQKTLVDKTRAIAAYDDGFSKGVAVATALLRLVGEQEHAERLRPSTKRPGTLEPEASQEPEVSEETADNEEQGEAAPV